MSLITTDIDLGENELNSLSPKQQQKNVFFEENGNNPFSGYLTETNPFHESNPFNPFRDGDNGNSDGQSEPESLTSSKEVCVFVTLLKKPSTIKKNIFLEPYW